jgi:hypothetical protein
MVTAQPRAELGWIATSLPGAGSGFRRVPDYGDPLQSHYTYVDYE